MHAICDSHHYCWGMHEPAKALYSDGERALNIGAANAILKDRGTEHRIRAAGQHATIVEARNGILR
eukprot:8350846-Pyramimonas_sp.AAC.1